MLKQKTQVWTHLILCVMGCINLIKMVLLPKILCMLWHSPVYLVLRHFKLMKALLKPFVWGNNRHKLPWHKLKNPTDLAGMALPDFNLYYFAAQLSLIFHIDKGDRERFLCFLSPKWSQPTLNTQVAITGGSEGEVTDRRSPLYQYKKVWSIASEKLHIPSLHDFTSLWHNTTLPEFNLIPDSRVWSSRGVLYLSHITHNGKLKPFDSPKSEFALPNQMFFRYIYSFAMPSAHSSP